MATMQEQLEQLDRDFAAPHSTMHVDTYRAKHAELVEQARVERIEAERMKAAEPPPAPPKPKLFTRAQFEFLAKTIIPVMAEHVRERIAAKVAPLEARIAELEARPTMKYRGIYDGGLEDYAAGDVVTSKGVLWFCLQATKDRPGESRSWKMMHKTDGR